MRHLYRGVPFALLLLVAFHHSVPAAGSDVIQIIIKKQEEKKRYRWSLDEWFRVRNQMRLQDMWFAMNAPSPYEFFLGVDYVWGETSSGAHDAEHWRLSFAAYARIFGLELEKVFRNEEWLAVFNMRIFGRYVQSTNITLQGGLRSQKAPAIFRNPFFGISVSLYVLKPLGIEGLYRHYITSFANDAGLRTWGNRYELNVFLDYQVLRVFGGYVHETERIVSGLPTSNNNLNGLNAGIKLFF